MDYLYFSLIGLVGSLVGSYIGIGGGVIFVPLLLLLTEDNIFLATAISTAAIVFLSAASVIKYSYQKRAPDWKIALPMGVASCLGGILFSLFVQPLMSKIVMASAYIALALIMLILMILKRKIQLNFSQKFIITFPLGFLGGALSGIFGIGGGVIYIPLMVILFNYDVKKAGVTSLLIVGLSSVAVFISHLAQGHISSTDDWIVLIITGLLAIVGSLIGTQLNIWSSTKLVDLAFVLIIILIIVLNILKLVP